jgi:hypothetical protein
MQETSSDRATPTDMSSDAVPLELNDAIKEAIGTAFESLNFVTVAYNGDDGWPHVSRRGSTQVFGPQQMAIWVRKRDDGLAKAVETRPEVTLFYLDLIERGVAYTFYGRGHVSTDPDVADQVFAASPEPEQAQDPDRKGVALIIELERVVAAGHKPENNFVMTR